MPYAGTLLGGEVQTQSMQPPSFTEKALRRVPSSWAVGQNDIQKRRATRTAALYSIRLNRTTSIKRRTTVFQKQTTDCQISQQCSRVHLSTEISCTKTLSTLSIVTTNTILQPLRKCPGWAPVIESLYEQSRAYSPRFHQQAYTGA